MDSGEKCRGPFVVSCSDGGVLFELGEEVFDQVVSPPLLRPIASSESICYPASLRRNVDGP